MSLKQTISQRLRDLSADPKRSLGQNFLISEDKIARIISKLMTIEKPFRLIEVGPGLGSLTDELLKIDSEIKLIELDRIFAEYWRGRGLQVIEQDALKLNWGECVEKNIKSVLVSNLPYQISASIVIDRCHGPAEIKEMILMFQKEVAQRITSPVEEKSYGLLSVMAQTFFEVKKVADLGARDFFPPPKIASRVLYFKRKDEDTSPQKFLSFCKQAFSQRRKLVIKNLGPWFSAGHRESESLESVFEELGLSRLSRAENLSPLQMKTLFWRLE